MLRDTAKNLARRTIPRGMRNWLRSPSKSIQWVVDEIRFSLGDVERLDITETFSLLCPPHAQKVFRQSQMNDADQSAEFLDFARYCSPGMFLFDIGAHYGIFSLAAAKAGGRAIAVDPSPGAVKMIERLIQLNDCRNQVDAVCAAASDHSGTIELLDTGVFSDGYFMSAHTRPKQELTTTRAVTIDELASLHGEPTHIKIDVEGAEASVLRGAEQTLRSGTPVLFIELHNAMVSAENRDPRETPTLLENLGYQLCDHSGQELSSENLFEKPIIRIVASRNAHRSVIADMAC